MTTKKSTKNKAKPKAKKKQPDLKSRGRGGLNELGCGSGFDGKFKKWSEIRDELYGLYGAHTYTRNYDKTRFEGIATEPKTKDLTITQALIAEECDAIKDLLIRKNSDYGNSVLEEGGVFSDLDPCEGIRVRVDDKLKRIKNLRAGCLYDKEEDTIADLIGYLILLRVAERQLGLGRATGSWLDDWLSQRRGNKE